MDTPPTLDHGEVVTHQLNGTSKNNIVFLGDSHMEQYWPRFKAIYSNKPQQYKAIFATYDGCPSIATGNKECDAIFMSALKAASNDETKKVVFASYWEASLKNKGVELDKILQHFEYLVQALKNQGKIPIIVLSNPTGSEFNPRNLINRFTKDPTVIEERFLSRSQFEASANPVLGKLKELAIYCDSNGRCNVMENGNPKYKDDDHIRAQYSKDKIKYLDHILR